MVKGINSTINYMSSDVGATSDQEEEDLNFSSIIDSNALEYNYKKDNPKLSENGVQIPARWLHEPDENDKTKCFTLQRYPHLLLWRLAELIRNSACGIDHMWSIFHATSDPEDGWYCCGSEAWITTQRYYSTVSCKNLSHHFANRPF